MASSPQNIINTPEPVRQDSLKVTGRCVKEWARAETKVCRPVAIQKEFFLIPLDGTNALIKSKKYYIKNINYCTNITKN